MNKFDEIEMPLVIFNAYLGYINMMIDKTNYEHPYKELVEILPINCTDEEKEKWFYQTLAYVASLKLGGLKNENT